jgi:hypothetical protein
MDNQDNPFAMALTAANQRIDLIDNEHQILQTKQQRLIAEKIMLIDTQHQLRIQVGEIPPPHHSLPQTLSKSKNSFKGMGIAAAARKWLFEIGRPQTHTQLVEALLKRGLTIASKHPANAIRTAMAKHPEWFRWVKDDGDRGRWELVEWPTQTNPQNDNTSEPTTNVTALSLVT